MVTLNANGIMHDRMIQTKPNTLVVNEIFHTVQGESTHVGRPCVFIRLTYCNLRCTYCDTAYAFEEGKEMHVDEILSVVRAFECKLVEVTGGEPLFQNNVHPLLTRLCAEGFEVLLETSGSLDVGGVDPRVKRIVDFKCPSSSMMKKNLWENVKYLKPNDEVKFVIGTREDYEWSKSMIRLHEIDKRCSLLMSVVFGALEPAQLADWILEDKLNVRFQLQLHKYIWEPNKKGV